MKKLVLKRNDKHFIVDCPNSTRMQIYMINTSDICIKINDKKHISFKTWLEDYYRGIQLDNAYIKNQMYILAILKTDPVTKEKYLEEIKTGELLVFEDDYFSGNGVYIKDIVDIDKLTPVNYSLFYKEFIKWEPQDFYHFKQNYYKFIEDGEKILGELLSAKIREEEKGIKLVKEYCRK
jgi:hypothetical protein